MSKIIQPNLMPVRYNVENKASQIDGRGAFALERIPARSKIGDLGGEVITMRAAREKVKKYKRIALVELDNNLALDATVNSNELRYVNHSCAPNTYMRIRGMHVEFYSLRPIKKGEELTCNYGETHHEGGMNCRCGAPGCKGLI
jgi:uncharacterized protein